MQEKLEKEQFYELLSKIRVTSSFGHMTRIGLSIFIDLDQHEIPLELFLNTCTVRGSFFHFDAFYKVGNLAFTMWKKYRYSHMTSDFRVGTY